MSDTNKIGNAEKPKKKTRDAATRRQCPQNKVYLCGILFLYMCLVSNTLCHVFIHCFFFFAWVCLFFVVVKYTDHKIYHRTH